ncbi:rhodanese-like domain-containing protein [Clostridium lacusfryxellense]|nr:rhodanese-like domain-containing protein [Clostridium lacusfryxellense]
MNKEATTQGSKVSFTNIIPQDAKKRLDSEEKIILLDVRTIEEYEAGHIKGSTLIPVDNLKKESENSLKDKGMPIFVYCRSGSRSLKAANILIKQGYNKVYNLGGINDWPYDVEK